MPDGPQQEGTTQSTNSDPEQIVLDFNGALEYIRNISDPQQALLTFSQFWGLIPSGARVEPAVYELYKELRQRHKSDSVEQNWGQQYLSMRVGNFGATILEQFQVTGNLSELDLSITCLRDAVDLAARAQIVQPVFLSNLANALLLRFEFNGSMTDLQESIDFQQQAVALTTPEDPSLLLRLRSLGLVLNHRFKQLGSQQDLENAIIHFRKAISLLPEVHSNRPSILNDLGNALRERFTQFNNSEDIEEAISSHRRSLSSTPDGDPEMSERLNSLAMSLGARYDHAGHEPDLEEAKSCFEQALLLTPDSSPDKPGRFNNLANCLQTRFNRYRIRSDLDEALSLHHCAVKMVSETHRQRPTMIKSMAALFHLRFEYFGDFQDIQAAIQHQRHALSLLPETTPLRASVLNEQGASLILRYQRTGSVDDLSQAIELQSLALALRSGNVSQRATCLNNLSSSLLQRYDRFGFKDDIDKAVDCADQAVQLTRDNSMQRPLYLNVLASALSLRFERLRQASDIEKAVSSCKLAISLTPENHAKKSQWLNNLGSILSVWFDFTGKLAYLDEAITYQDEAVPLSGDDHPQKPMWLANLGKSLGSRFELLGDRRDINRSISSHRLAVNLAPNDSSNAGLLLSGLGNALRLRFERLKLHSDLEEAIRFQRQALDHTPLDHAARPLRLNNLANCLMEQSAFLDDDSRFEEAIELYRKAVELSSNDDPRTPIWLNNLGVSVTRRYELLKAPSDLDEGLCLLEKAVSICPDDFPEKARWLRNLAYIIQYRVAQDPKDMSNRFWLLNTLFHSHRAAAEWPAIRMETAQHLSTYTVHFGMGPAALAAYGLAMETVPTYVWLGTTINHRRQNIVQLRSLASEAAAEAIKQGRYDLALEWLEEGRSIIWNQLLKLRTPLDALRQANNALAERLETVSAALEHLSMDPLPASDSATVEQTTKALHQFAIERDDLIRRIHQLPGFEDFLEPLKQSALVEAAHSSTVVLINVHSSRCDALAIPLHSRTVIHIPLPALSYHTAVLHSQKWAQSLRLKGVQERGFKSQRSEGIGSDRLFCDIMASLWSTVVHPILDHLKLLVDNGKPSKLPRVTWCATGPLSFLPLHAAGIYESGSKEKTFECVVSSYTPTLSALLAKPLPPANFRGLLTVSQSTTAGMSALPGTLEELDKVERYFSGMRLTRLEGSQATLKSVLDGLHNHSWAHLACHASQNPHDPTRSAFYLHDKPLDLANISRSPFKDAGFAFLSACQTATGVEELSDEASHLAAGMLMSGYPSVIATMWSVRDQDAPIVADKVYAGLLSGGVISAQNAAQSLHNAVGDLREKVGEQNFRAWAPYIHIGI